MAMSTSPGTFKPNTPGKGPSLPPIDETNTGKTSKRPAPTRGTASYPRKRANKACQVCRARRTKCDNKKPSCSFCEKAGTVCTWAPNDFSSFDPASLAILERFDQLESLILSNGTPTQPAIDQSGTLYRQQPPMDQRLGCVPKDLVNVRLEAVLQWETLRVRLGDEVPQPEDSIQSPSSRVVVSNLGELDMATCSKLLDSFWNRVHSKNPILVRDDIKRYMQQVCMDGISWDAKSCLVLLICAIGTLATDFTHGGPGTHIDEAQKLAQAQHYFEASMKRISVCLGKRGLLEAQCFFYCGVYHITILQPEPAWSMFLQARASCQGFQWLTSIVARSSDYGSEMKPNDSWVAEECTYWTCLKSELELYIELAPPGFRIIDLWYPEKFPDPPRHTITESDRSWFFYLAEIALRRLSNRIIGYISRDFDLDEPQSLATAQEIAFGFEKEAQDWIQSLPLPNALDEYKDDVLNFILKGHLNNCYELTYWPFMKHAINQKRDTPIHDDFVRKGLQAAVDRLKSDKVGFRHRHHGTYGMIRACTRSAFVLLAAHCNGNLIELMPSGWFESVLSVVDLLGFWQDELGPAGKWRDSMILLMNNI